jgi:hypothetical protein
LMDWPDVEVCKACRLFLSFHALQINLVFNIYFTNLLLYKKNCSICSIICKFLQIFATWKPIYSKDWWQKAGFFCIFLS